MKPRRAPVACLSLFAFVAGCAAPVDSASKVARIEPGDSGGPPVRAAIHTLVAVHPDPAGAEGSSGTPSCAHDLCKSGKALSAACEPCVADLCSQDWFCCDRGWDTTCVQEAEWVCGAVRRQVGR